MSVLPAALVESTGEDLPHETLHVVKGRRSGLTISIAVHSTVLGPALGGCRVWTYDSWLDAVADSLRLAEGMTLKNAAAGLNRGGGKTVVYIPRGVELTPTLRYEAMLDLGDAIENLGGSYMTAEDVGTSAEDMAVVATRTAHVCGLPSADGGVGEPSDATAAGVYAGLLATLQRAVGTRSVEGRRVTVLGLGHVGSLMAMRLASEGDLFVPAGVGGVLTDTVIDELRVKAVVGPANNQLAHRSGAERLAARGILWAPDFVVNAGGVIFLAMMNEEQPSAEATAARVERIGDTVAEVFAVAEERGITTLAAADELALARLREPANA